MAFNDWLPNFKGALNAFYEEKLKNDWEIKSQEYKDLLQEHLNHWRNTQKALIAVALGIFITLTIAHFWKD